MDSDSNLHETFAKKFPNGELLDGEYILKKCYPSRLLQPQFQKVHLSPQLPITTQFL